MATMAMHSMACSASLATDVSGAKVSEQRYPSLRSGQALPYGGTRSGEMPTDRQFTGQRNESSLGFYDYVARQYDPALGRFLQADSIVPNPGNPQSLNRYSYTLGNPLRYTDPSGHYSEEEIMKSFGVSTWDEVLAFFQNENSSLYGRWGWLEILRRATDGTSLDQGVTYSLSGGIADWRGRGIFVSSSSGIFLRCLKNLSGSELMQLNPLQWERLVDQKIVGAGQGEFAGRGEASDLYQLGGEGGFITSIWSQHNAFRWNTNINYSALVFDTLGLVTCPVGGKGVQSAITIGIKGKAAVELETALKVAGDIIPAGSIIASTTDGVTASDVLGWGMTAGSWAFSSNPIIGCPFAAGSVINDVVVYGP